VTNPWLSRCRSEVVVLDTKCGYLEGWIQDPDNSLKHYQGQGGPWMLASWILHTVFKPAFTGKVFSLTTAPLDCNHTCVSSFSSTQCSTGFNASPDLVLFFLMKQLTSLFTSQWHMMASDCRNAQFPIKLIQHLHFL